jgi:CRP-like cAMP-binding protein
MQAGHPFSRLLLRLERSSVLSDADRRQIANLPFKIINCPARSDIVSRGYAPSGSNLVLDGLLFSYKTVSGAGRQITSFFIPGDIAGLATLYLPIADHSIASVGPAVLAFVPHAALQQTIETSAVLAQALWRETLMQGAIFHEQIANVGRRDAFARLAHIVCELALRLRAKRPTRDCSFAMPCTQRQIADACGISAVHANRVIQELRRLGLLDWDSGRLKFTT